MNEDVLIIYCDGGARGNPGPGASGVVVVNGMGETRMEIGKFLGVATNNAAEYAAVISALKWVLEEKVKAQKIIFKLDSLLVVKQLLGEYRVKDTRLKLLFSEIKNLEKKMTQKFKYVYIPRNENWRADKVVNQTLDCQH